MIIESNARHRSGFPPSTPARSRPGTTGTGLTNLTLVASWHAYSNSCGTRTVRPEKLGNDKDKDGQHVAAIGVRAAGKGPNVAT